MQLTLERFSFSERSTIGALSVNGKPFCWSLELPVKDGLPGSAIPAGTYKVIAYNSPHFQREMPLITGIPGRSEIEIHWGSYPENTSGCILLGGSLPEKDMVGDSRQMFDDFWEVAKGPIEAGDCVITVK